MRLTGLNSVLCLGAHADDIEIGCGGAVLRLLQDNPGLEVHWVVLSAPGERSTEARDSAGLMLEAAAVADIRLADFRESYFPYVGHDLKAFLGQLGTELSPDVIFTHWREDLHQDHRTVGELTWNSFRNHLILEYEIPKWDGDMGRPNIFLPLERSLCAQKVDHIMAAFPSQLGKDWFTGEVFWSLLRLRGMEARSSSGYAEGFHCRKLVLN
jgi:LmbE family N-acetylglucosaminyl deacetylase